MKIHIDKIKPNAIIPERFTEHGSTYALHAANEIPIILSDTRVNAEYYVQSLKVSKILEPPFLVRGSATTIPLGFKLRHSKDVAIRIIPIDGLSIVYGGLLLDEQGFVHSPNFDTEYALEIYIKNANITKIIMPQQVIAEMQFFKLANIKIEEIIHETSN